MNVSFFRNISKTAQTTFIKKKKLSETMAFWFTRHRVNIEKIIFYEILIILAKMSVSTDIY